MKGISIRRFSPEDTNSIIVLATRNLLEVNIRDYPRDLMEKFAAMYTPDYVSYLAGKGHCYVAGRNREVVGCGTVMLFRGREEDESVLLSIYVLPELQGLGIGKRIMAALESDPYFVRSRRIEIPATLTACGFYEKFGYGYKNGRKEPDDEGAYHMEKFRSI